MAAKPSMLPRLLFAPLGADTKSHGSETLPWFSATPRNQKLLFIACLFMVPDHLINDEAQEFFGKFRIQISRFGQ